MAVLELSFTCIHTILFTHILGMYIMSKSMNESSLLNLNVFVDHDHADVPEILLRVIVLRVLVRFHHVDVPAKHKSQYLCWNGSV